MIGKPILLAAALLGMVMKIASLLLTVLAGS